MSNAFFTWDDDYLQDEKMHKSFVLSPTEPYSLVEKRGKLFASLANKLTKYKLDIIKTGAKNTGILQCLLSLSCMTNKSFL